MSLIGQFREYIDNCGGEFHIHHLSDYVGREPSDIKYVLNVLQSNNEIELVRYEGINKCHRPGTRGIYRKKEIVSVNKAINSFIFNTILHSRR